MYSDNSGYAAVRTGIPSSGEQSLNARLHRSPDLLLGHQPVQHAQVSVNDHVLIGDLHRPADRVTKKTHFGGECECQNGAAPALMLIDDFNWPGGQPFEYVVDGAGYRLDHLLLCFFMRENDAHPPMNLTYKCSARDY